MKRGNGLGNGRLVIRDMEQFEFVGVANVWPALCLGMGLGVRIFFVVPGNTIEYHEKRASAPRPVEGAPFLLPGM